MIATLVRVFTTLTTDKPTLVREIVVPNLPTTIGNLLNFCALSDPSSSISDVEILANVLEALRDILQSHPITFRPFAQKTHTLILSVLSSSTSSGEERLAREIFALLHLCASGSSRGITLGNTGSGSSSSGNKATAVADEWARGFKAVIQDVHSTLNMVFRGVLEDNDYSRSGSFGGQENGRESTMEATGSSALGLADWNGIMEGAERVAILLRLLQSFFTLPLTAQVSIPAGQLVDLTTRIFSVMPSTAHINVAVERAERELVFARLPELHRGALDLTSTVVERLSGLFSPFALLLVEQVAYIFNEGSWNAEIKMATYYLLNSLLDKFGTGLTKATVQSIHPILAATCDDLLPPPATTSNLAAKSGKQQRNKNGASGQNFHADAFLSILPAGKFTFPGLVSAATILLATALAKLPTSQIRSELRTKMDRTAVLTGNTEAMLASVLFPPAGARRGGSILPHLVGTGSGNTLVVEGVIRPRLPIVWTGKRNGDDEEDEMEDDEEREEDVESEEDDEMEVVDALGSSKNPYTEEKPNGESSHKRQKTELGAFPGATGKQIDRARDYAGAERRGLLSELSVHDRELSEKNMKLATELTATDISARAATVIPVSGATIVPSPFPSKIVVSSTPVTEMKNKKSEVVKTKAFSGGGDSDDDMEIPEIVMGESSSEDESEHGFESGDEE